jgi:hypothetical protein
MEAKMDPDDIEPIETATPAGISDAAGLAGTASPDPIPIFHLLPPRFHLMSLVFQVGRATLGAPEDCLLAILSEEGVGNSVTT